MMGYVYTGNSCWPGRDPGALALVPASHQKWEILLGSRSQHLAKLPTYEEIPARPGLWKIRNTRQRSHIFRGLGLARQMLLRTTEIHIENPGSHARRETSRGAPSGYA